MELLWIAIAFVAGLLFRQIGLPPMVGYLASGFLINALGMEAGESLATIAHVGVLLLMFSIGLKIRLKNVARIEVWGGALLHLALTGSVLGLALGLLSGLNWGTALVLALTLGFSSTVMAAKVLEGKQELRAFHGRVAIGILIIQDLVAVALLSFSGDHAPSWPVLLLLGLPLLAPLLNRLVLLSGHDELLLLLGLLLAVGAGLGFEQLGLSGELGALVLGTMLANHGKAQELGEALWGLKEAFLVGFFLQIGLSGWPTLEALSIALLLTLAVPLKAALFFFTLLRFKLRARTSFLAALSLASYSEFALIVAQTGAENGWLGEEWLVILALAIALSFVIAAPFNRLAHALYERYESQLSVWELPDRHPDEQPISLGKAHILIMGMGRTGTAAYDFLTLRHERIVGLDSDPGKVAMHIQAGRRVLYADAEDPGFWQNLRLKEITAVMLMMPDPEADRIAARLLRSSGFTGLIGAICHYPEEIEVLKSAGADLTFNYFEEVGVGFAEHIWEALYDKLPHPDEARA